MLMYFVGTKVNYQSGSADAKWTGGQLEVIGQADSVKARQSVTRSLKVLLVARLVGRRLLRLWLGLRLGLEVIH